MHYTTYQSRQASMMESPAGTLGNWEQFETSTICHTNESHKWRPEQKIYLSHLCDLLALNFSRLKVLKLCLVQADDYQSTGCYNLNQECTADSPGFVQVSNKVLIGGSIYPTSSLGSTQYEIKLLVFKVPIRKTQCSLFHWISILEPF